jgi:hypothetical protein
MLFVSRLRARLLRPNSWKRIRKGETVRMGRVDDLQRSDRRYDSDDISIPTHSPFITQPIALLIHGPCLRDYPSRNVRQINGAVIF